MRGLRYPRRKRGYTGLPAMKEQDSPLQGSCWTASLSRRGGRSEDVVAAPLLADINAQQPSKFDARHLARNGIAIAGANPKKEEKEEVSEEDRRKREELEQHIAALQARNPQSASIAVLQEKFDAMPKLKEPVDPNQVPEPKTARRPQDPADQLEIIRRLEHFQARKVAFRNQVTQWHGQITEYQRLIAEAEAANAAEAEAEGVDLASTNAKIAQHRRTAERVASEDCVRFRP